MQVRCTLCKSLSHLKNIRDNFKYYYCPVCKVLFLHPRPQKNIIDLYYQHDFTYNAGKTNEKLIRQRSRLILDKLQKLSSNGTSLLDIGSGYGYFLGEAMKRRLQVYGIEPAQKLIRTSIYKKIGHVYPMNLSTYVRKHSKKKFDFITLIHVIEHVNNPSLLIKQSLSLLKQNGILYIETPNLDSHLYRAERNNYTFLTPPDHLWIFSIQSFKLLLNKTQYLLHFSTYSYPEHFMGILKNVIKKPVTSGYYQPKRLIMEHQNNVKQGDNILKSIKYYIFDRVLARILYPLLNLHCYGSILELYIKKK